MVEERRINLLVMCSWDSLGSQVLQEKTQLRAHANTPALLTLQHCAKVNSYPDLLRHYSSSAVANGQSHNPTFGEMEASSKGQSGRQTLCEEVQGLRSFNEVLVGSTCKDTGLRQKQGARMLMAFSLGLYTKLRAHESRAVRRSVRDTCKLQARSPPNTTTAC